jgi:hypothetical protein
MASSRAQEEKNLKVIRELMKLPANKRCFDCGQMVRRRGLFFGRALLISMEQRVLYLFSLETVTNKPVVM